MENDDDDDDDAAAINIIITHHQNSRLRISVDRRYIPNHHIRWRRRLYVCVQLWLFFMVVHNLTEKKEIFFLVIKKNKKKRQHLIDGFGVFHLISHSLFGSNWMLVVVVVETNFWLCVCAWIHWVFFLSESNE